jgi:hypothetical protein
MLQGGTSCPWVRIMLALMLLLVPAAVMARPVSSSASSSCRPTDHDVCVVGAGGSGMFAAWKLQQKGLRVFVLEKAGYVGGHCRTFYDVPNGTGAPVEMGVQVYVNTPLVQSTLAALNIQTAPPGEVECCNRFLACNGLPFAHINVSLSSIPLTGVTPWDVDVCMCAYY